MLSSLSSSVPLGPCPAELAPGPGRAVPGRAQLQGRAAAAPDKGFAAKGDPLRTRHGGFVELQQLPQPLCDFPKLGTGTVCMKVPWWKGSP